jgi:hypothetical protein
VQMISTTRGLSAVSIPRAASGEDHAGSLFRRAVSS